MPLTPLRAARQRAGLSQQAAAARMGVSQPYYSQLEGGTRFLPEEVASLAVDKLGASPSVLPLPPLSIAWPTVSPERLTSALAALGYPPFGHLRKAARPINPALVVAGALAHADLDVRLVESLPWALAAFADLDVEWLAAQCRLLNLQNRLGYLVALANEGETRTPHLVRLGSQLEVARLAGEGTLCRDSMSRAERDWIRKNRSTTAEHWRLLTSLTREQLPYAS
ncbi:MAG: helix-turn-helix transcriptional regulator [Bryobacteraceae bacterium]|nr:helix-turn-helix transcriptional regulator [Bryobacteraceae bacterium]